MAKRPPLHESQVDGFFRANVGILLIDDEGRALMAERKEMPGAWQLPQGGIDPGETVPEAAVRELGEELGLDPGERKELVEVVAEHPRWLAYELPEQAWSMKNGRGQVQKFVVCRFSGDDALLDERIGRSKELAAWRWSSMDEVVARAWPPRRPVYEDLRAWLAALPDA